MKERVSYTLEKEAVEIINDLAMAYGVSRSVIVERMAKFIIENGLEGELFKVKRRKKASLNVSQNVQEEKEEVKSEGFKLTL